MTLTAGSRLGPYQILDLLGAGGMGVVYRARDERLERDVAIKVLPPATFDDERARHRFRKEALALAKLSHPNIATVYDVGEEQGTAYLVMECIAGESLATRLQRGTLGIVEALTVASQIAGALSEAHEHGVVHRDLKPANVMLTTKGQVKVLDFGLAKLLAPADSASLTVSRLEPNAPAGTPLYMSPEQAFGEQIDARTDLWSLGVVMYESLAGRPPFSGGTDWALLQAVSNTTPTSLRTIRIDVPAPVEALVSRAMTKDPGARYQTADALAADANQILAAMSAPSHPRGESARTQHPHIVAFTALGLIALAGAATWSAMHFTHVNWARHHALTTADSLYNADLPLASFAILDRARGYLPGDTALEHFAETHSETIAIRSTPAGVPVAIQDYLSPDSAWQPLGVTPISKVTIPKGYFRWRVSPPGRTPIVTAPLTRNTMDFAVDSANLGAPGMVRVAANTYDAYVANAGWVGPYALPPFDIDRYEVTNGEYQQFVDSGGYSNRAYWKEPIVDQGKTVSWDDAMLRFRDHSNRPGPSTWTGGHYPEGEADFPVSGVSWYEASAYAAFRSKSLPTVSQWYDAAPDLITRYIGRMSNMSHTKVARVGAFNGLGAYGTYDMAGNVREWTLNANDAGARFILGGSWSSPDYLYDELDMMPPLDRSAANGIRCVRNLGPLPPATEQPIRMFNRDFAHITPVSDAVFNAYKVLYQYDQTPLNARVEGIVQQTADWRLEKVSYDAAYNHERITAYLYLPTHVKPPYQTVLFFPSARVLFLSDSKQLGDVQFFDYVVQSGRAVLYPIYQDTYERRLRGMLPGAGTHLDLMTQRSKDVQRSLDYLQTRSDIDSTDLAYMGVSMGAAEGVIYATLAQNRLRTAVFLDGGFFLNQPPAGGDQVDFVTRFHKPALMVNGRYDGTFTLAETQLPMFRMLGTPAADKSHVILETAHDVTSQRSKLIQPVLAWLDQYMGRVR
ncbi:MAG TPA: bifunctional serine/threonine-protein kinase/formylglycine-generating enzyme family protein [Gemmatimonadales bacterium]|jgi:serine/threonine protein kinase